MQSSYRFVLALILCGAFAACTKGYRFNEAVYNASQTQKKLNTLPAERLGMQEMNYVQYESERKRQP